MDIQKRESESFLDWKLRLITAKIDKVIDLDWSEISEILQLGCSGDHLRKTSYGIYEYAKYFEEKEKEGISDDEVLTKLDMKQIEMQKEKEKNRTIKIEVNKMLRKDARFEMFIEDIKNNIESSPTPIFEEYITNSGEKIGLLGISDIHFSKCFNSVNNSYSIEIFYERMSQLLSEVSEWIIERNITYLHVVNNGDSVEGLLRINAIRVLEIGVIDSVIEFSKAMAEWLNSLSKYIPFTYHHIISSNHTEIRFLNVKAGSFPDEDLEKIIINMIAGLLKDNKRINIPMYKEDYAYFQIFDKNIFIIHGHQFRGKKTQNIIKELQLLHDIKIDILILGHLHHEENITVGENDKGNVKTIYLPAVMGSDNFSDSLYTGSKAGATLIEFNEGKKGITTTEVILN